MQRDRIVVEIQSRLNLIKIVNGYAFDIRYVYRNPENEPSPEIMPMTNIFEFPSTTIDSHKRGASKMPAYKKFFRVAMEHWYNSSSQGETSRDIMMFLRAARLSIFSDGTTLGGLAYSVVEEEESKIYRPQHNVIGIGEVLAIEFIEDFDKL